ncbi:MAG: hypothetical protein G8345_16900 [Magnetococcales bacterium]|nr:hypothetical protein [Magnetococcales bacterium]
MATVEEVADSMYKLVEEFTGKKRFKPGDLIKHVEKELGADKNLAKSAIRILTDDGKLVYSYFGGTWLELPYVEGAAKKD